MNVAHDGLPRVFQKYHGAENDFLFCRLPAALEAPSDAAQMSEVLCARHTGWGADGLVFWKVDTANGALSRVEMDIWNSDGSRAATCGNALRCLGLALYQSGSWGGDTPMAVHPLSGEGRAFATLYGFTPAEGEAASVGPSNVWQGAASVGMGFPQSARSLVLSPSIQELFLPACGLRSADLLRSLTWVDLENPHLVAHIESDEQESRHWPHILEESLAQHALALKERLFELGLTPRAEFNLGVLGSFPRETNHHQLIVHERGAGVTRACGSGATAAYFSLVGRSQERGAPAEELLQTLKKWAATQPSPDQTHSFEMPGGQLQIALSPGKADQGQQVEAIMTGPCTHVGQAGLRLPLSSSS